MRRYGVERAGQNPDYTKTPAPWLNGDRWLDESQAVRVNGNGNGPTIDQAGNVIAPAPSARSNNKPTFAQAKDEAAALLGIDREQRQ